jgi:hypothetical protein
MERVEAASEKIYELLVEEEDARVCLDIPDAACDEQPLAFTLQLGTQTLTKLGDALTSSRLALAWMLGAGLGVIDTYLGTDGVLVLLLLMALLAVARSATLVSVSVDAGAAPQMK